MILFVAFTLIAIEFRHFSKGSDTRLRLGLRGFSVVFLCCGIGHAFEALTFYAAPYRLMALWDVITAVVAVVVSVFSALSISRFAI